MYDITNHTIGSLEYSLLDGINQERSKIELPPLALDPTLCALSAVRAYECSLDFSHTRPNGKPGYSILEEYDYAIWTVTDERNYQGSTGIPESIIIKGWMRNNSFSASILSECYTHIGIGTYTTGNITYIVLLFGG